MPNPTRKDETALAIRRVRILNGNRMETKESAHEHLARRLRLPNWYGRNLDALNDCLGEIGEPTTILFRNAARLPETLGAYGERMLFVLKQAAEANERITLVLR